MGYVAVPMSSNCLMVGFGSWRARSTLSWNNGIEDVDDTCKISQSWDCLVRFGIAPLHTLAKTRETTSCYLKSISIPIQISDHLLVGYLGLRRDRLYYTWNNHFKGHTDTIAHLSSVT